MINLKIGIIYSKMKKILVTLFILIFSTVHPQNQGYHNGVVSSAQELASQVGIDILKKGGNAIDAAVGVGFTLAVVYPQAGNIGGGGFMVIQFSNGKNTSIDFREKAPLLANKNMYLDADGNVIEDLSTLGHLSVGVPGSVAGMLYALEKYGTMNRADVMKYAISYAENGFKINDRLAYALNENKNNFDRFTGSSKIFGKHFKSGDLFIQKDLASTLKAIRDYGKDGFYKGWVADLIVTEMKNGNGIISYKDLSEYNAVERETIKGTYRKYDIVTMGPPASGGICLIYLLNILENYNLKDNGFGSTENIHLMTEAMKRVYADRSEFMGDADYTFVPVEILTSKKYASRRMWNYDNKFATKSSDILPSDPYYREQEHTTHYSVADKFGNLVSTTTTLNDNFGSKVVVDGAGFLLNDEMDDFSSKPGVPNMFGLIGSEANSIAPGKRMLSSMTPTIILKDGKPFLIIGSPGGGKIITSVLQTIVNIIDYNFDLNKAIDLPRFHHQWYPDVLQVEKSMLLQMNKKDLEEMGYTIKEIPDFGRIDAIMFLSDGSMTGYSDSRGYGKAVGY
jgi:gamma-glutamyltranspeptidase / glutathione hydrolase